MDNKIKSLLIEEGIQQCQEVLGKDKKLLKQFPNGVEFFKGCMSGFHESQKFLCLEQVEIMIMHLKQQECEYRKKIEDKKKKTKIGTGADFMKWKAGKAYADVMGKRCAIEYLYKNLLDQTR